MIAPENPCGCDCSPDDFVIESVSFEPFDCCPPPQFATAEIDGRTMTVTTEQAFGEGFDITPLVEDRPRC